MANQIPTLDWGAGNIAESFKLFQQRMKLYFTIKNTPVAEQVPTILLATGDEGLRRFNSWSLTALQSADPEAIFTCFLEQLEPPENFRISRLKLGKFHQRADESLDMFVNRCKLLANQCDFKEDELNERLVELIIASTPMADFQKELLNKPKGMKLCDTLALGRSHEASANHVRELQQLHSGPFRQSVDGIKDRGRRTTRCKCCGDDHQVGKQNCPARNDTCNSCQKQGHWAKYCLSAKYHSAKTPDRGRHTQHYAASTNSHRNAKAPGRGQHNSYPPRQNYRTQQSGTGQHRTQAYAQNSRSFHTVEQGHDYDETSPVVENYTFDVLESNPRRNEAYATLQIKLDNLPGTHSFKLKIDTGAQANTMPFRTYGQMFPNNVDECGNPNSKFLQPTNSTLTAYNGSEITCRGTVDIDCAYNGQQWTSTQFFVVDVPGPAILGLVTCEELHVVTVHCALNRNTVQEYEPIKDTADLVRRYPQQFDRIGELEKVCKLVVDPNVPSRIDAPRRTPIAMKDKIKAELDSMTEQNIISRIEEPTDWVSSLTCVTKRDGSVRVCLDPRQLNKALIRPYHQAQTVEELNHKFANANFFSKLDAKAGYWSIKLDVESQKLTTFQTPFGRYCYLRLPFGLSVSQDIFQRELDRILEKCQGIADDFVIYGSTEQEHDNNLTHFMDIAKQHGLVLNSKKCEIKSKQVSFFGQLYTSNGMKPDPQKVSDLREMPEPTNKVELQQFLGFITYLSRFVKDFSTKSATLRDLLRQDSEFIWDGASPKSICFAQERSVGEFAPALL